VRVGEQGTFTQSCVTKRKKPGLMFPLTLQTFTPDEAALPGEKNLSAGLVALAGGGILVQRIHYFFIT